MAHAKEIEDEEFKQELDVDTRFSFPQVLTEHSHSCETSHYRS